MSAPAPVVYRMRLKDAAAAFGIGYDNLQQACKKGELPAVMPLGAWLVTPADVEAWLQRRHEERVEASP